MLRALLEHGVRPDVILGTSVGALNGAMVAVDPRLDMVERLTGLWLEVQRSGVLAGSVLGRVRTLARTRTHAHTNEPLRGLLEDVFDEQRIEDLAVPFQCVAASIERASEHWFSSGPVVEAVLASAAVPGALPPVEIGGEHFLDGGIVNSIPVGRAVQLGARTVYVLHVGRIERPLEPPTWPWEVAMVAFEIARRHRFHSDMASIPPGVTVHVLPTGEASPPRYSELAQLRYRDFSQVRRRIETAYLASRRYLEAEGAGLG
jgi:NTE family protein